MLWDYRLQAQLQADVSAIQLDAYFGEHAEVVAQQNRALSICQDNICDTCRKPVMPNIPLVDLLAFTCGHIYHISCLAGSYDEQYCSICKLLNEDIE